MASQDLRIGGVTLGGISFVAAIICGLMAVADIFGETASWIGLALAFNAGGNLLGGVRTERQAPLPTDT